jgi:hypothetical protein
MKIKLKTFVAMKCSHLKEDKVTYREVKERGEMCARTLTKEK